ncbi:MAG: S46 family peptidase, partial [Melioribacteraceae bacterium]|nr:S46 family peptidase [Melioribacteraceae bacterium]
MRLKINPKIILINIIYILFSTIMFAQNSDEITAESDVFDTGKMWTFDFPPTDYLEETYGFKPTQEWFDDVRLSALRIPGCTASFVSANGLIMTNNHCSPGHRDKVQLEGEDLAETGFYAETLADERKVPNMYAEQLAFIQDVTEEVNEAVDAVESNEEKIEAKEDKIKELVNFYNDETGLKCQFVSLFNGGKFSIYGYK